MKLTLNALCRQMAKSDDTLVGFLTGLGSRMGLRYAVQVFSRVDGLPKFLPDLDSPRGVVTWGEILQSPSREVASRLVYTVEEWSPSVLAVFSTWDKATASSFNACGIYKVPRCLRFDQPVIDFYLSRGAHVYTVGFSDRGIGRECVPDFNLVAAMWNLRLARPSVLSKR